MIAVQWRTRQNLQSHDRLFHLAVSAGRVGELCKVVELARGGSVINLASLSSLYPIKLFLF